MGWDDDKTGDYVPKPVPRVVWLAVVLVIAAISIIAAVAS